MPIRYVIHVCDCSPPLFFGIQWELILFNQATRHSQDYLTLPSYLGPRFDLPAEGGVLAGRLEHLLAEGEVPQGVVEVDLEGVCLSVVVVNPRKI